MSAFSSRACMPPSNAWTILISTRWGSNRLYRLKTDLVLRARGLGGEKAEAPK